MKKLISVLVGVLMIFSCMNVAMAVEDNDIMLISGYDFDDVRLISTNVIRVQNEGEYIDFADENGLVVEPQIINDRTMVPFRNIFNALGVSNDNIVWDGTTRTVKAQKDDVKIELQIDNEVAKKTCSGETEEIRLDSAPVIINGRTLVPVRFIAESMNKKVGWDNWNRTVIIIDLEAMKEDLEQSIPNYMAMIADASERLPEYKSQVKITGKVEYKDTANKSYNSTLNFTGNIDTITLPQMLSADLLLKFTGKGSIYDVIKENHLTSLDGKIILAENSLYFKSSLLDQIGDNYKGKWIQYEDEAIKEYFDMINGESTDMTLADALEMLTDNMTVDTYESLKLVTTILKTLLNNENVKISGKEGNRTYTTTIDMNDIQALLKEIDSTVELENIKGKLVATTTVKNHVAEKSSCEIEYQLKEGTESISFTIKADGKNSATTSKIQLPKESQIMPYSE